MQEITVTEFEFARDYFEPIKEIVREGNPLIASAFIEGISDIYCLETFMLRDKSTKLNVLLDNNIFTNLVYLAKGNEAQGNDEKIKDYKFCCAVMCFFILGYFDIEPNLSLYERASKDCHSNIIEDLYHFRVANNIHPMGYAELALGVSNKLHTQVIEDAKNGIDHSFRRTEETNYEKNLNDWRLAYLHLLKMVDLLKNTSEDKERIRLYFDWIIQDCLIAPGTIIFAIVFFSPRKLRKMIKKVNSNNLDLLKEGIKNTAWDLTYIARFQKKSKHQPDNTIWFFCTRDDTLQKIIRHNFLKPGEEIDGATQNLINDYWGKRKGLEIYKLYDLMRVQVLSDIEYRKIRNGNVRLQIDKMIERLENKFFLQTS